MECYLKREIDIEMGHEMEGSICADDEFCWSEVVFLFQEDPSDHFLSANIILAKEVSDERYVRNQAHNPGAQAHVFRVWVQTIGDFPTQYS